MHLRVLERNNNIFENIFCDKNRNGIITAIIVLKKLQRNPDVDSNVRNVALMAIMFAQTE